MSTIKKVWLDKHDEEWVVLSLQSEHVQPKGMRLEVTEKVSGEPESLHKLEIGLLSIDDLEMIVDEIKIYLEGNRI